jgi:hypothetical protein
VIRRLFWALLGLGIGLVLGIRIVQKVEEVAEKRRPTTVATNAGRRAGAFQTRLRSAVAAGREAAAEREVLLRERFGVPSLQELAAEQGDEPDGSAG